MKCQFYFLSYVDDILVACICIKGNFVIFTFMNKRFSLILCGKEKDRWVFWEIAVDSTIFINKPLTFLEVHGFNNLIQKYFSEEQEKIYQCSIKSKTTEGNSAAINFAWILYGSISHSIYVIFLHFSGL